MPLQNIRYLQELRERFFQKILDDWDTKWGHFPLIEQDDFSSLPSLNAFIEQLHEDIDDTLRLKLPSKERIEMMISKENLRRILKSTHQIRLQSHTRNCLAYYLGFDGWEDFKEKITLCISTEPIQVNYVQVYQSFLPQKQTAPIQLRPNPDYVILANNPFWKTKIFKQIIFGILVFIILGLGGFKTYQWYKIRPFTPEQLAKVNFEIIEDYAKPNNNHFKIRYDVTSLSCDSVIIDFDADQTYTIDYQQNGGTYQEVFKTKADTISHTYFEPNISEIKLIVRNQLIRTIKKIVYSGKEWIGLANGRYQNKPWQGHLKSQKEIVNNGVMYLSPSLIDKPNASVNFWTNFKMINDFDLNADSLVFESRIKNNYQEGGINCFDSEIKIITDKKNTISGNFLQDCIEYATITIGDFQMKGSKKNMNFMDVNLQKWQIIKVKIKNHVAFFYVNDKEVFKRQCGRGLGEIKGISYNFKGSGAVDWVKMQNSYTGKVVFYDDFTR
jgi:hypothetical protein